MQYIYCCYQTISLTI